MGNIGLSDISRSVEIVFFLEEQKTIVFQAELVVYQAQPAVPRLGKQ